MPRLGDKHRLRAVLRHERILAAHRTAAGAAHAERLPVVDDFVLRAWHHAVTVIENFVVGVAHLAGEHIPLRHIHARTERPAPCQHQAAIDQTSASLRIGDARRDQTIGIVAPHFLLRLGTEHRHIAMVRTQVGDIPAHRAIAARQHFGDIDIRDEIQLHAAPRFRLVVAEQARAMQLGFDFRHHARGAVGGGGMFAQERNHVLRAAQGLVVGDVGKIILHALSIRL